MAIKCQILIVSLGKPFLGTYWAFSHARKLKIENRFLHCNQHLELQVLSTHMAYFWDKFFLTFNRAIMNFKLKTRHGSHWSLSICFFSDGSEHPTAWKSDWVKLKFQFCCFSLHLNIYIYIIIVFCPAATLLLISNCLTSWLTVNISITVCPIWLCQFWWYP